MSLFYFNFLCFFFDSVFYILCFVFLIIKLQYFVKKKKKDEVLADCDIVFMSIKKSILAKEINLEKKNALAKS